MPDSNYFPTMKESGEAFGTEPPARDIVGVQPQGFPASDIALPKGSALKQRILEGYQRAAPEEEQELFSTTHKDKWGEVKGKDIYINEDRFKKEGATEGYLEDMFFGEALHGLKDSVPEWYDRLHSASEQDLADPNSPFSQWRNNSFSVVTGEAPDEYGAIKTENLEKRDMNKWWDVSRFDQLVGGYLFGGEGANQPTMRSWNPDAMPYGPNFRKELEAFKQALEEEDVAPSVDTQSILLHEMLKNLLGGVPGPR